MSVLLGVGSGTWTPDATLPTGTLLHIETWGAASGGSGRVSTSVGGGGGGGAPWAETYDTVTPTDVTNGYAYTVPAGGAGGVNAVAAAGGATSFGTAATNLIPNSSYYGASTSPSTLPRGWAFIGNGVTATVIDIGTDVGLGLPYITINFNGTCAGTNFYLNLGQQAVGVPCLPLQAHRLSGYLARVSANWTGVTGVDWHLYTNVAGTGAYVTDLVYSIASGSLPTTSLTLFGQTLTTGATVGAMGFNCIFLCSNPTTFTNLQVKFCGFQLETGSSRGTWQSTPSGYCLAGGGLGQTGSSGAAAESNGAGGAGSCNCYGIFSYHGGAGATRAQGGGGGGSGGPGGIGATATTATGGTADGSVVAAGASNVLGGGGGTGSSVAGSTGGIGGDPGGGGGGVTASSGTNTGGQGGDGQIRLTWVLAVNCTQTLFRLSSVASANSAPAANNASSTQSVAILAAVGDTDLFDQASATNNLAALSGSGTAYDWSFSGSGQLEVLASVAAAQQYNQVSATNTLAVLKSVATATLSVSASATNSVETLAASGNAYDWFFSGINSLEALTATGAAAQYDQASATQTLERLTSVVSMGQSNPATSTDTLEALTATGTAYDWSFSGTNSFLTLAASGSVTQYDRASATQSLEILSAAATAGLGIGTSGTNTLLTLTGSGTAYNWSFAGTGTLEVLAAAATAGQSDQASAIQSLELLSSVATVQNPTPVSALDSFFRLTSVVTVGQSDQASATNTLEVLAGSGTAYDWSFSGSGSFFSLAASGVAGQSDQASATQSLEILTAAGFAGQGNPAFSSNTLEALTATGVAQAIAGGTCLQTFAALAATGTVAQYDQASATQSLEVLRSVVAVVNPTPVAGLNTFFTLAGSAALTSSTNASATDTFDVLAIVAAAGQQDLVQAADSFLGLSVTGQVQSPLPVAATGALTLLASGALGQSDPISVTAAVTLTTAAQMVQGNGVRAIADFATIAVVSSFLNRAPVSAANSVEVLLAQVAVSNPTPANTTNSINFAAIATTQQYDQACATAAIGLTASGNVAESDPVLATQSLEILAAVVQLGQSNAVQATNDLDLSTTGVAQTKVSASATNTILFNGRGTAYQFDLIFAAATVSLSAVADVVFTTPAASLQAIDIDAQGIAGQVNPISATDSIVFSFIGASRQEVAIEAFGQTTFMGLQAIGAVKKFTLGLHRQIWFEKDDRYVYWPPTQTSISPRTPDPTTLTGEGRHVYWPPNVSTRR